MLTVRHSFALLLATLVLAAGTAQAKPGLTFNGTKFYPAYEASAAGMTLVEYVPKGESIDHWKQLLSVRTIADLQDPAGYLYQLEKEVKASNPSARAEVHKKDLMIDFLMFSEDGHTGEFNVMRVAREGSGLVVYQYALHIFDLHEKSDEEIRKMGQELAAYRAEIVPIFGKYGFQGQK